MSQELQTAVDGIKDALHPTEQTYAPADDIEVILEGQESQHDSNQSEEGHEPTHERDSKPRYGKKRRTSNDRIGELTYKNKMLEAQAFQAMQALERERNERQYERQDLNRFAHEKTQETLWERENALKVKILATEQAYVTADNEEDAGRKAEAQSLMAKYNADLAILQEKKRMPMAPMLPPVQHQDPFYYSQPQQQQAMPVENNYNPAFEDWMERNPWYGKDEKLTREADQIGDELKGIFAYNQMDHLVAQDDFLQALDSKMSSRYALNDQAQAQPASQPYNQPQFNYQERHAPVAPINRQGGGYPTYGPQPQAPQPGRRQAYVSADAQEILDRMKTRINGVEAPLSAKLKMYGEGQHNIARTANPMGNLFQTTRR